MAFLGASYSQVSIRRRVGIWLTYSVLADDITTQMKGIRVLELGSWAFTGLALQAAIHGRGLLITGSRRAVAGCIVVTGSLSRRLVIAAKRNHNSRD